MAIFHCKVAIVIVELEAMILGSLENPHNYPICVFICKYIGGTSQLCENIGYMLASKDRYICILCSISYIYIVYIYISYRYIPYTAYLISCYACYI